MSRGHIPLQRYASAPIAFAIYGLAPFLGELVTIPVPGFQRRSRDLYAEITSTWWFANTPVKIAGGTDNSGTAAVNTYSKNITLPAGHKLVFSLSISNRRSSTDSPLSSVKLGAVTLTSRAAQQPVSGTQASTYIYGDTTTQTGTVAVEITWTGTATFSEFNWALWEGCDQTTPFTATTWGSNNGGATTTHITVTGITGTTSDQVLLCSWGVGNTTETYTADETLIAQGASINGTAATDVRGGLSYMVGGGATQMGWTRATGASARIQVAVVVGVNGTATSGTGSITVTPTLSATGKKGAAGTGSITSIISQTATGAKAGRGTGSLSSVSSLAATGRKAGAGTGTVGVTSSLSGAGVKAGLGSGALGITASLSGAGAKASAGSGAISVSAVLAGAGAKSVTSSGAISCSVALSATGFKGGIGSADLVVSMAMSGTGVAHVNAADVPGHLIVTSTAEAVAAVGHRPESAIALANRPEAHMSIGHD